MKLIFRTETEEKDLRIKDKNRLSIKEYNKQEATKILEEAGIFQKNPLYNKYHALTMANVHNARRFGTYNSEIKKMFIETLMDPDLSFEQYKTISKEFTKVQITEQLKNAEGNIHNEAPTSYEQIMENLKNTMYNGIKMRDELGTTFPEIFIQNNKLVSRLYVDIPPDFMEESAMPIIKMISHEYSDFIYFDEDKNQFIVNNNPVGPQKFFNNKIKLLERFKADTFEANDIELFEIIKNADFVNLKELKKKRGINRDKTNISLINAIDDKFLLFEISKSLKDKEINKENCELIFDILKKNYEKQAQIISKESEKDTLGYIDTVMFSIAPYDLATQSTFRAWKSCMHMVGVNQKYVDDTIGMGSIIAYGFSSSNPHEMISRLLIHPYTNNKGEIAYKANKRIYGKENLSFRKIVDMFVRENLNKGKNGSFIFNRDKGDGEKGFLYDDYNDEKELIVVNVIEGKKIDFNNYLTTTKLNLSHMDLSLASNVILPDNLKQLVFNNTKLPNGIKKLDLSKCGKLSISNTDLSILDELLMPENIDKIDNVVLPRNFKKLDLSKCEELFILNTDLSNIEELILPKDININNVILPKNSKKLDLSKHEKLSISNTDLSNIDELIFPEEVDMDNVILSKNLKKLDLSKCKKLSIYNTDLSNIDELILPENINKLDNVILPKKLKKLDLSKCKKLSIYNTDLSNIDELILPENINKLDNVILPKKLKKLDARNCNSKTFDLLNTHLIDIDELILPNIHDLTSVCLPQNLMKLDLSNCTNLYHLYDKDLSNLDKLILPPSLLSVQKTKLPKITDFSQCHTISSDGLKEADFSETKTLIFPQKINTAEHLSNCNLELLDLSYSESVIFDFKNADLSNISELKISPNILHIHGKDAKFPKKVNLHHSTNIILEGIDFTSTEDLILPEKISELKNVKLPKHLKVLDLSKCDNINLYGTDLSNLDTTIFPEHLGSVEHTKFPKKVDMHCCKIDDLSHADFSNTEELVLPASCKSSTNINFSPKLKILDMSYIDEANLSGDLSNLTEFTPPKKIRHISGTKFPRITDLSNCCETTEFYGVDFSKTEKLKLPKSIKNLKNLKLPATLKFLDLSECTDIELTAKDLIHLEKVKLPKNFDKSRLPEGLYESSEVIRNAIYEINPNLRKIDNLKKQTQNRHIYDNNFIRPIKYAIKQIQYKLRHKNNIR